MIQDTYYTGTKHISPNVNVWDETDWINSGGRKCDIIKTTLPTSTNITDTFDFEEQPTFLIIMNEDAPGIWFYTAATFNTRYWYSDGWYVNEWRNTPRNYLRCSEVAATQTAASYVGSFTNTTVDLDLDDVDPLSVSDKYMLAVDTGAGTKSVKVHDGIRFNNKQIQIWDGTKWSYTTRRYATGSSAGTTIASTLGWEAKYIYVKSAVAGGWLFIKDGYNYFGGITHHVLYVGSTLLTCYSDLNYTGTWDTTSFNLTLPLATSTTNTWYAWE